MSGSRVRGVGGSMSNDGVSDVGLSELSAMNKSTRPLQR